MELHLNMNLIIKTLNSSNLFLIFDFIYFDFDKINKNIKITIAYLLYTHLHDFYPKIY
jgi:hypothetical protein